MLPNAVPKPRKSKPKGRVFGKHGKLLPRKTRIKSRNAKRQGSSFPKQRNPAHCRWVVEETRCVGAGRIFMRPVSIHDMARYWNPADWLHMCWGEHDPAHVGAHRAQGAPDLGHVVNMCRALHNFYDEHREMFAKVTGLTERKLAHIAAGNALQYVERGGIPEHL